MKLSKVMQEALDKDQALIATLANELVAVGTRLGILVTIEPMRVPGVQGYRCKVSTQPMRYRWTPIMEQKAQEEQELLNEAQRKEKSVALEYAIKTLKGCGKP